MKSYLYWQKIHMWNWHPHFLAGGGLVAHWWDNIEGNSNLFQTCTTSDHNHIKNQGKEGFHVFKSQFNIVNFSLSVSLMNSACKLGRLKNVSELSDSTVQPSFLLVSLCPILDCIFARKRTLACKIKLENPCYKKF